MGKHPRDIAAILYENAGFQADPVPDPFPPTTAATLASKSSAAPTVNLVSEPTLLGSVHQGASGNQAPTGPHAAPIQSGTNEPQNGWDRASTT